MFLMIGTKILLDEEKNWTNLPRFSPQKTTLNLLLYLALLVSAKVNSFLNLPTGKESLLLAVPSSGSRQSTQALSCKDISKWGKSYKYPILPRRP